MDIIKAKRSAKIKSENTQLSIFLKTQIFSVVAYIIIFFTGSLIGLSADLPGKYDFIFSLAIFFVGSLSTGFFAGLKLRHNGLLTGILFSLPMNIITMLISFISSDFSFGYNMALTAVVLLVSAGIGGILAVNKRVRR